MKNLRRSDIPFDLSGSLTRSLLKPLLLKAGLETVNEANECLTWCFGNWRHGKLSDFPKRWNVRHKDIFEVNEMYFKSSVLKCLNYWVQYKKWSGHDDHSTAQ